MATRTRRSPKPAYTAGRYTVLFSELDWDGDPSFDVHEDGEYSEGGYSLDEAKDAADRLDRQDRVTALREQLEDLTSGLDDDTEETIARLTAAIAAIRG